MPTLTGFKVNSSLNASENYANNKKTATILMVAVSVNAGVKRLARTFKVGVNTP
jgi:hypothetical protein